MSQSKLKHIKPRYEKGNPIWKFFYINDKTCSYAKCNECGKDYCRGVITKNTTNLRAHLKQKHPQLFRRLLILCEKQKKPSPPLIVEDHDDIVVGVSTAIDKDVDVPVGDIADAMVAEDADFLDAIDDYVDDRGETFNGERSDESTDETSSMAAFNHSDNSFSSLFAVEESLACQSLHSNSHQQEQEYSINDANSTKPNLSMSEEELRKRLLIAQIEKEQAQAQREISVSGYYQARSSCCIL